MKRLISMSICFVFVVCVMTACGNNKDMKNTDTTTKHTTLATEATQFNTVPTLENTQPSTIPDSGSMPHDDTNKNDQGTNSDTRKETGGAMNDGTRSSRTHAPSIVGGSR